MDDMTARICQFMREEILVDDSQPLDADTPLLGGAMDSLGLVQLSAFLEKQYEVDIDDADMVAENFRTPAEIARFVRSHLPAGGRSGQNEGADPPPPPQQELRVE